MSLRRPAAAPPSPDPVLVRIQREHELNGALEAARSLQARLEMVGDRPDDVAWVRELRDDLAQEIHGLAGLPDRSPQAGDGDLVVSNPPYEASHRNVADPSSSRSAG